ncbi:hypothetical protein ACPCG0_10005 [Propionibacteriaceae bacterium Y1923]
MAVTGSLTQLTPHAHTRELGTASSAELQVSSQGLELTGRASPLLVGENRFEFTLTHDGTPVGGTPGRFTAVGHLPTADTWQLQVSVRVSQFDQPVAVVRVPIR